MLFGRCGVRVAKSPTFAPSSRGGCTLDLAAALPFWSKMKSSQTCEKWERPSSECTALRPAPSLSVSVAVLEGQTQPCRGVPFFSMKHVRTSPMGTPLHGRSAPGAPPSAHSAVGGGACASAEPDGSAGSADRS